MFRMHSPWTTHGKGLGQKPWQRDPPQRAARRYLRLKQLRVIETGGEAELWFRTSYTVVTRSELSFSGFMSRPLVTARIPR